MFTLNEWNITRCKFDHRGVFFFTWENLSLVFNSANNVLKYKNKHIPRIQELFQTSGKSVDQHHTNLIMVVTYRILELIIEMSFISAVKSY